MYREVFKRNMLKVLLLPLLTTVVFAFVYLNTDMPLWTLLVLIVPFTFANIGIKTKIIVEKDVLYYERAFRRDEVDLKDVAKIVMREEEHGPDALNREVMFVLAESGHLFFSFSAKLINGKNQRRFEETVNRVNANIEMS